MHHPGLEIDAARARTWRAPASRSRRAAAARRARLRHRGAPGWLSFGSARRARRDREAHWLRTESSRSISPRSRAPGCARARRILYGCQLSATQAIPLGRAGLDRPRLARLRLRPARSRRRSSAQLRARSIGDHVWIAADCTVLRASRSARTPSSARARCARGRAAAHPRLRPAGGAARCGRRSLEGALTRERRAAHRALRTGGVRQGRARPPAGRRPRDRRGVRAARGRAPRSARRRGGAAGPAAAAPRRFRRKGEAIPERVGEHRALRADLNVLAYVTAIIPPEILDAPPHGSLCFHPSLLPRYRGGAAVAWQIILGDAEAGVTVFRPDEGVDTGPIVVQKGGVKSGPRHGGHALLQAALRAGRRRRRGGGGADRRGKGGVPRAGRVARELPGTGRRRGRAHRLGRARRRARSADPRLRPAAGRTRCAATSRCGSSTRGSSPAARRRCRGRCSGSRTGACTSRRAAAASPSRARASAAARRWRSRSRACVAGERLA